MARLDVRFCGIDFKNPFLLASTPATRADKWARIAKGGWAGGVTWGGERSNVVPLTRLYSNSRFIDRNDPAPTWCCQLGMGRGPSMPVEQTWTDPVVLARRVSDAKKGGIPVCANVLEPGEVERWVVSSRAAEEAGADMLELNLSCPVQPFGLHFSRNLSLNDAIVRSVRRATKIPIMAKLHMWLLPQDLKAQAKTVVEAGADAISVSNILTGIAGIDINTGLPHAKDQDNTGIMRGSASPISGPAIKPFALRAVAEVASVVDVPISGMGGITNWRHAVEFIMAGCATVQVGMGAMLFGYDLGRELCAGLTTFMEEKGYNRIDDFSGLTRRRISGFGETWAATARDLGQRIVVDKALCDGCGNCVRCCIATGDGAARMRNRVAYIDHQKCIQCRTCTLVCPKGAIKAV